MFSKRKCRTSCLTLQLQEVDAALDVVALAPENSDGFLADAAKCPTASSTQGKTRTTKVIVTVARSSAYQSRRTGKGKERGNTENGAHSTSDWYGQHAPTSTNAGSETAASVEGRKKDATGHRRTAQSGARAELLETLCVGSRAWVKPTRTTVPRHAYAKHIREKVKERRRPSQDKDKARQRVRRARAG